MAITGLQPLPVKVSSKDALAILGLLSTVGGKVGRLDEKFRHSIVSDSLVQILSLSESVESTRIEGTQATFTDMVEEKDDRNPRWEVLLPIDTTAAKRKRPPTTRLYFGVNTMWYLHIHFECDRL